MYEDTITTGKEQNSTGENFDDERKDAWISVYPGYRSGMRYDHPVKNPDLSFWIRKSFHYRDSSGTLLYNYELFASDLRFILPRAGNFILHQMSDGFKPICTCADPFILSEISDGKGEYRKMYWPRIGMEDLTIFAILCFHRSLKSFINWKDYDDFKEQCTFNGLDSIEIDELLSREIKHLGLARQ